MRRARGFAPLPVFVQEKLPAVLAVGAHQKNTIAASVGQQVFVSQHIGDLETQEAFGAFERVIESFKNLYEFEPQAIACDMHPNYLSSEICTAEWVAGDRSTTSLRARAGLHGGERSRGPGAWDFVGRQRIWTGRNGLGR